MNKMFEDLAKALKTNRPDPDDWENRRFAYELLQLQWEKDVERTVSILLPYSGFNPDEFMKIINK